MPDKVKKGFVLPMAIVLMIVTGIILTAVFSYASFTTRMTQVHIGNSKCRLAAQSSIECLKKDIFNKFRDYSETSEMKGRLLTGVAFDWFRIASSNATAIGLGQYVVNIPPTNLFGCAVRPVVHQSRHLAGETFAVVTLRATATRDNPGGSQSSSTIEERIWFGLNRSSVFDYAYFVNNYGWFQGSSITANGDVRANGDLYLDSGCVVNGHAYASRNDELGVYGIIQNKGTYQNLNDYNRLSGNRARPADCAGGYIVPDSAAARLHDRQREVVMPYISALEEYITFAQSQNGNLSGGLRYTMNNKGEIRSTANERINAHYDGAGPSGDPSLADNGALVLEGTSTNPIRIDGPVVVDSDVIIKGYVTGQGTIYSGRNIHIVGDLTYVNAPSWPHPDANLKNTNTANGSKDILGLAAKGNIVLGDCTNSSWLGNDQTGSLQYYLKHGPYVQKYICDESDKNIGYPRTRAYGWSSDELKFCGDYTQQDGGKKVEVTSKKVGNVTTYTLKDTKTRRYYDSVCAVNLIKQLSTDTSSGNYGYTPNIKRIDAVLYNNHGIIGRIGNCTINGSLVCRNEAMIYSGALHINWDYRLYHGLNDPGVARMGLPLDASNDPVLLSWREVSQMSGN